MDSALVNQDRPNLHRRFFWEYRYDDIDWQKGYTIIIERIIERGGDEEYLEIIRYYGLEKVIHALLHEIGYMHDYAIDRACKYFDLKKEDMFCWREKFSKPGPRFI